jgi:hypothetical protein
VLVGPSTAVTPAPRAPASRFIGEEKEMGIEGWKLEQVSVGCDVIPSPRGERRKP